MATASAIAKRTERRQIDILEAVKVLVAEVAELKAEVAELKERMAPATKTPAARTKR